MKTTVPGEIKDKQVIIGIIELGGTINSSSENPAAEFYKKPSASIFSIVEELNIKSNITLFIDSFAQIISHEITSQTLIKLAKRIQTLLNEPKVNGIVVTSGTNALEDIAYFIGLVVRTIKPIVFTGAQFPRGSLAFDGRRNLFNAIQIASSKDAIDLGVLVTFNDYVVTAREATKTTPGLTNHFSTEGAGIVGHIISGKFVLKSKPIYRHTAKSEFSIEKIDNLPSIAIIYAHLLMDEFLINASITSKVSGIISAGYGKGYQNEIISQALKKAVLAGIPVVRCSRSGCGYSGIDKNYDNKYGFIVATNLSPHKASLLLSLILDRTNDPKKMQNAFEEY